MTAAPKDQTSGREYYEGDVDFDILAAKDPDFAAITKVGKTQRRIDFQDPKVVQQLTKTLLKHDFNLILDLPPDRLCPPVPVRWNYIRWIQTLLDTTSEQYTEHYAPSREVVGLDIGVGASAIYPLLACSTRAQWRMAGTDVDQHSLTYARQNVTTNGLEKRIRLALSTEDAPLLPLDRLGDLDFVMTNPPFYASETDLHASYKSKPTPPSAICTGSANEMICPDGEVGFVSRILEESLLHRDRVQWYTAMLGKLPSLHVILAKLKEHGIKNFAVTSLRAGYKTNRWAVGWSFGDLRPRNDVAREGVGGGKLELPAPTAQTIAVPLMSQEWAGAKVDAAMRELDVRWRWRGDLTTGVMETEGNVWSRAARRKKKFGANEKKMQDRVEGDGEGCDDDEGPPVALATKITCRAEAVEVTWLRGHDYVLFTSFCGMLKSALATRSESAS